VLSLLRLISWRHLIDHPLRSVLTVIGVTVGVATMIGVSSINRTVMGAFRSTIDLIAGKTDLVVAGASTGFEDTFVDEVRKVPGVGHANGGFTTIAPVQGSPGESLFVMGVDFLDDGFFRSYEGKDTDVAALSDNLEFLNSADRMLVSERFAAAHNYKTGDTFTLLTKDGPKDFIIHGQVKETGPIKRSTAAPASIASTWQWRPAATSKR
jgi:putative ABC transport system permease protein